MLRRTCVVAGVLALALLAQIAIGQQTYIVDASGGPGVDFTDIPPAIAAVQIGDVLLVQAGSYSAFELDRGLTILGYGMPQVLGSARVVGLPAGQVGVIAGLLPYDLVIENCAGTVVVQHLGQMQRLVVEGSDDVRLLGLDIDAGGPAELDSASLGASRVEAVSSKFRGSFGSQAPLSSSPPVHDGGRALHLVGTRLHLVASNARGGNGQITLAWSYAGSGGHAIRAEAGSELVLAGGGDSQIIGGLQGWCLDCTTCNLDGSSGYAISLVNSSCRWSAAYLFGPETWFGDHCHPGAGTQIGAGGSSTVTEAVPADPILRLVAAPLSGQPAQLEIRGVRMSPVRLVLGRTPVVIAEPPIVIERLVSPERTLTLGLIPGSGELSVSLPVPMPPGSRFFAQAEVDDPITGEMRRTNSVPIIVR